MKLEKRIQNFEHYETKFKDWIATEKIIDDKRALWELKLKDSNVQKICLYRDGKDMFVYGDYGQFTFDSMTWLGSVYNLEYDNIGYQMEKLSYESKKELHVFDDTECEKDIIKWCINVIDCRYDTIRDSDEELDELCLKVKEYLSNRYRGDLDEFCELNNCFDIRELLYFTDELFSHADEDEWIAFLRNSTNEIQEYDEVYESSLWDAGKTISQKYFICMYALKVCGEKLKNKGVD